MRKMMQLKKTLLAGLALLSLAVTTSVYAADTQDYTTADFDQSVNPGLYPPLSSGEASPWTDNNEAETPDLSGNHNLWGGLSAVPVTPAPAPYGGVPVTPVNPYYGYQVQPQTPYYYPAQPYGYAPPAYGYAPSYPVLPYGNYAPYGSSPFGGMPFEPYPFNGGNPFGFSMPWPF